jgi:hypothetical protein
MQDQSPPAKPRTPAKPESSAKPDVAATPKNSAESKASAPLQPWGGPDGFADSSATANEAASDTVSASWLSPEMRPTLWRGLAVIVFVVIASGVVPLFRPDDEKENQAVPAAKDPASEDDKSLRTTPLPQQPDKARKLPAPPREDR